MISFTVSRLFLILIIRRCHAIDSSSTELCTRNKTVSCSQQILLKEFDDCLIHTTDICRQHKLNSSPPLKYLYKDKDASFEVSLIPYPNGNRSTFYNSAVNVSLDTFDPEITGFFLFLQLEERVFYNSCRIFDFSKSKGTLPKNNISLFYDCYNVLENDEIYTYTLIIRAVPINNELQYKFKAPKAEKIDPSDMCDWEAGVMVNVPSLTINNVELKFSPAPAHFEVEYYRVYIQNHHHIIVREVNASNTIGTKMISASLDKIPNGSYQLFITPCKSNTTQCAPAEPMELMVSGIDNVSLHDWVFAFIIGGALFIVAILGFVMFKVCQNVGDGKTGGGSMLNLPKPKVFILYSYDCQEHMRVILKFADYLRTFCNAEVILDVELNNQSLTFCLQETITSCQFFVIVVSPGIYHKIVKKNKPMLEEGSPFGDQFTAAHILVKEKYEKTSRDCQNNLPKDSCQIIKVFFEYSKLVDVPDSLKHVGKSFELFGELNHFLCQIHCQQPKSFPIKIYPRMPGSDILGSDKGKELDNAVKAMMAFQKHDKHWFRKMLCQNEIKEEETDLGEDSKKMVYLIANDERKSSSGSAFSVKATFSRGNAPESCELLSHDAVIEN